jgi:hypothetical protein
MARFYIETTGGKYYQFASTAAAYPDAILAKLGVIKESALPADAELEEMLTGDRYADFAIVVLRLTLADGKSKTRLASAVAPIGTLKGTDVFGSKIRKVRPARQRVRV